MVTKPPPIVGDMVVISICWYMYICYKWANIPLVCLYNTKYITSFLNPSPNQMTLHQTNLCAYSSYSIYLHLMILLFLIFLLCLQPTITATAPTNETDRFALLKIKESVPQDPYKILSSWNDSMHFCNWLGVKCGRRHQRVTVLDLQGHKLRGTLSPYVGNLSFLRSTRNWSFVPTATTLSLQ